MVRSRIPGGQLTADDLRAELYMCDEFGNGTLRITSRQGLQLHGVLKDDLKPTIRAINEKTTFLRSNFWNYTLIHVCFYITRE